MGKKQPNTPRSRIRAALRQLWLRSRERAAVLRAANYSCRKCGTKQTKAGKDKTQWINVEVHHVSMIDGWDKIIRLIEELLLQSEQECLCKECHKALHDKLKKDEAAG